MTRIQLQYHAHAREMIDLAAMWSEAFGLRVAVEQFFPEYRVLALRNHDFAEAIEKLGKVDRVALGRSEFDLTAEKTHHFVMRNAGCLFLSVEWPTAAGLSESAIEGATDDPGQLKMWRQMIRKAKEPMHKGAVVRGTLSGVTAPVPAHLHTIGAHKLAEQGIRMLASVGGPEFLFDDVSRPPR